MLNSIIAASVALAALSSAAPTEQLKVPFTVTQVATGNKKFLAGPVAMMHAYNKYNKPVPANVRAAAAAALQSGSVTATPQSYDSEYLCPVAVGSNGKVLNLDFDTGSSGMSLFSTTRISHVL